MEYRLGAIRLYEDEGTLEIDSKSPVSRFDDEDPYTGGAYVQAWVWVADEAAAENPIPSKTDKDAHSTPWRKAGTGGH